MLGITYSANRGNYTDDVEMNRQKIPEFHSMADSEKIAQMRKKMDGKSLEDDL